MQPADVPIFAYFAAQTYARYMVEVRGRVEGYIERWTFHPGAEVEAGQVLYVLDLRPYEASVAQAKGNLNQSEADLEFARRQVSLLQAQANLALAQANLLKAQQDRDRLKPLVEADAASQQDLDAAVAALAKFGPGELDAIFIGATFFLGPRFKRLADEGKTYQDYPVLERITADIARALAAMGPAAAEELNCCSQ